MSDGASPFPRTVEEIAAALRDDPILVSEVMGNGQTAELQAALEAKAEAVQAPVYVVMTKAPRSVNSENQSEELAVLLRQELGDGVYFVVTLDVGHTALRVYGDVLPQEDDQTTLLRAHQSASTKVQQQSLSACDDCHSHPGAQAGLVLDLVAAAEGEWNEQSPLTGSQITAYLGDPWVHRAVQMEWDDTPSDFEPSVGLSAVVATVTALVTTVLAYRLIQAIRSRPPADPQVESQLRLAEQAIVNAERKARREGLPAEALSEALEQLERARTLLASSNRLDQVGALVLARMADRVLTSKGRERYQACYVDPTHGEAGTEMALGGGLRVPVCKGCLKRHEAGHPRAALMERRSLGRRRPYYDGTSVWAANGYGALDPEFWRKVGR